MGRRSWIYTGLGVAVVLLAVTGVFVVVERGASLTHSLSTGMLPEHPYDAGFASRPVLTFLHIVPGFLFMVLGPLQFVPGIRSRYLNVHRWFGRIYLVAAVVAGLTALLMGFLIAFGGPNETVAVTFFSVIFLYSLGRAFLHIRRREVAAHREWMIRAFAVGLGVATMRPVVALFFAFTDLGLREVLGIAFWLALGLHLLVAEVWINHTRARVQA